METYFNGKKQSEAWVNGKKCSEIWKAGKLIFKRLNPADLFINAALITDLTQISAVNYLVSQLQEKNIWEKMIAIYPLVGGNAHSHKFNLKNPTDSDNAFRLIFRGGVVHSANGIQNGYADTKISDQNVNVDNLAIGAYSRTNSLSTTFDVFAGSGTAYIRLGFHSRYTDNTFYADMYNSITERIYFANINTSLGLFTMSRTSNNSFKAYRNNVLLGVNNNTRTNSFSGNIFIGSPALGLIRNIAFAFISQGLTEIETSNLYDIVQQYQTILGRQV